MSERKHNEILDDQRKARQEFLELKKMQQGEMNTGPKPSDVAIVPKTPKEKIKNYWYFYKWHTLAALAAAIIIIFSVTQCATAVKSDFEVVVFSYSGITDTQLSPIKAYMEKVCDDVNGDGKVSIQFVNCSYDKKNNNDGQYEYTMVTKIQATLAGDNQALLYITDPDSYKFFSSMEGADNLFADEPYVFGENLNSKLGSKVEDNLIMPENLQISCRAVKGTVLEGKKNMDKIEKESKKVIDAFKAEG